MPGASAARTKIAEKPKAKIPNPKAKYALGILFGFMDEESFMFNNHFQISQDLRIWGSQPNRVGRRNV